MNVCCLLLCTLLIASPPVDSDALVERWLAIDPVDRAALTDEFLAADRAVAVAAIAEIASRYSAQDPARRGLVPLAAELFSVWPAADRGALFEALGPAIGAYRGDSYVVDLGGRGQIRISDPLQSVLIQRFGRWWLDHPDEARAWFASEQGRLLGRHLLLEAVHVTTSSLTRDAVLPTLREEFDSATDPERRAWALAAEVRVSGVYPSRERTTDLFAGDESGELKRLLVRLSSFIPWGDADSLGLDLEALILETEDPALLEDAVRGWVLRDTHLSRRPHVEYFPGRWMSMLARRGSARRPPLDELQRERVLDRIRSVLADRQEPSLRDACSLALLPRTRSRTRTRSRPTEPGFRVAEWGVWVDGPNHLMSPARVLDELPSLVHRSGMTIDALSRERLYSPSIVTKPVVFFDCPSPLSISFEVCFAGGRPWSYYPDISDYSLQMRGVPFSIKTVHFEEDGRVVVTDEPLPAPIPPAVAALPVPPVGFWADAEIGRPPLRDAEDNAPPWQEKLEFDDARVHAELESRFAVAPWVRPSSRRIPTRICPGPQRLDSIGAEWRGLRVGGNAELEAPLREVEPGHWWHHCRAVGASDVAFRGEREKFLFYDGSTLSPGLVRVGWSDAERSIVAIRPRSIRSLDSARWLRWIRSHEFDRSSTEFSRVVPHIFIVAVGDDGVARGRRLSGIDCDSPTIQVPLDSLQLGRSSLRESLASSLIELGLTSAEAESLAKTWESDFFEQPGTRVITVLPQWYYDFMLPVTVTPRPETIVRAGLVWCESDAFTVQPDWIDEPSADAPRPWECPSEPLDVERRNGVRKEVPITEPFHRRHMELEVEFDDVDTLTVLVTSTSERRVVAAPVKAYRVSLSAETAILAYEGAAVRSCLSAGGRRLVLAEDEVIEVVDLVDGSSWTWNTNGRIKELEVSGDGSRVAWIEEARPTRRSTSVRDDSEGEADRALEDRSAAVVVDFEHGWSRPILTTHGRNFPGSFSWVNNAIALDYEGSLVALTAGYNDRDVLCFDLERGTVANLTNSYTAPRDVAFIDDKLVMLPSGHDLEADVRRVDPSGKGDGTPMFHVEDRELIRRHSRDGRWWLSMRGGEETRWIWFDLATGKRLEWRYYDGLLVCGLDPAHDRLAIRDLRRPKVGLELVSSAELERRVKERAEDR